MDTQLLTVRRQRAWDDLVYLERCIERHQRYLGFIPAHWQKARKLLLRDIKTWAETPYARTDFENGQQNA